MSDSAAIAIGSPVNLLSGYRSDWNPADDASSPFFAPSGAGVSTAGGRAAAAATGTWGDIVITLNDSAEDLLSSLYDFETYAGVGDTLEGRYPSGALLARNADRATALANLQQRFGIDFGVDGRGYALLELRRDDGAAVHQSFASGLFQRPVLQRETLRSLLRLPVAGRKGKLGAGLESAADADKYLDFFAMHGTHYVSSIGYGDRILQVLAYDAPQWTQLKSDFAAFPDLLHGPEAAAAFGPYTRPLHTGEGGTVFGAVAAAGTLTSISGDPAIAASVAGGAWNDPQWARGNSLLAPWLGTNLSLAGFTQSVPVTVLLTPLALAMDPARQAAAGQVFRAAMAVVYGDYVSPDFAGAVDPEFGGIYPTPRLALATVLATPTIETYVQRLDLGTFQIALASEVTSCGLFANLLEIRGADASLPGSQVSLLAGILSVIAPADGSVPTLTLSDDGYRNLLLNCDIFLGGLRIADQSGSEMIVADGIIYKRGDAGSDGRYQVVIDGDVHAAPTTDQLDAAATPMTAGVNGAEALLASWAAMAPQADLRIVIRFLEWIAGLIPAGGSDPTLSPIRLDALYMARAARALATGTQQAPALTFQAYQASVDAIRIVAGQIQTTITDYQDQIRQRQEQEILITDLATINQNVIQTGQLLSGYVAACAQNQADLASSSGDILANDRQVLDSLDSTAQALQSQVNAQQTAVTQAINAYKVAIEHAELDAIVKMSFDVAENLFKLGFAPEVPEGAGADGASIKSIVETIQKMIAAIDAVNKLRAAIAGGQAEIALADTALEALGTQPTAAAAALNWDEFRARMKNAILKGPAMAERDDAATAVDILVMRGEALVQTQASAADVIGRMYREQRRQQDQAAQAARLQALQGLLKPASVPQLDIGDIDLLGLSGELAQLQSQMMVQLVRAVVIQDMALQYQYLQPPTSPPSSFDLISIGLYIVQQQGNLVAAKTALRPVPTVIEGPVAYVVDGIPVSALADGGSFTFHIPPSAAAFLPFTMVRVASVDLIVEGLESTTGGQFVARLLYSGQPFFDRDQEQRSLTFATAPRLVNYLGTVVPGGASAASAGSDPSTDHSLVTPFSDWEFSLPADSVNAGLAFSGQSVKLTLNFHLVAQINPSAPLRAMMAADSAAVGGTVQTLLSGMAGKSCLMGWDAVFNYTEEKVNTFLAAEYAALKAADKGHLVIPVRTDKTPASPGNQGTWTTWSMTLGPPSVAFLAGNSAFANVTLAILDATYAHGLVNSDGSLQPPFATLEPPLPGNASITGQIALGTASGTVTGQQNVIINLPAGSWILQNLTVIAGNPMFNAFLTTQLATVSSTYSLGTLQTGTGQNLPALAPTQFKFAVLQTPSQANILQLFIATTGSLQSTTALNSNVPEPVPSGFDCSLMISSKILFQDILPASFKAAQSFLTITGVDPNDSNKAWSALASSGSMSVPLTLSDDTLRVSSPISVSMAGLTIAPNASSNLDLSYAGGFTQDFDAQYCEVRYHGACFQEGWAGHSVYVNSTVAATISLSLAGSGEDQQLAMGCSAANVQSNGNISSGPCSEGSLQNEIVTAFQNTSQPAIATAVSMSFPAISILALKDLLFPAKNMVNMSEGYMPGDVLVLGSFATS